MKKPKIAFFDFTCCEGCQLQVINLGEALLEVLNLIEVVEFREAMSEKWSGKLDIAIIEGSITTPHEAERVKAIRERANSVIALGACATIGGVNGMKNNFNLEEIGKVVYGDKFADFPTQETRAVHQVVKVDYFVNNCPIYLPEFVKVLKAALQGIPYPVPDWAVCVECKLNENVCMYDKGIACLGPITKAGCNSWCINNGNICYGCRGMVSNPAKNGAVDVMAKYNIPLELIINKMNMYNKCRELDSNEQKKS